MTSAPAPATTPAADATTVPLGWAAFSERYFPGRPRHDHEAITAYAAYRTNGVPPIG
jgi:hypothetical protein